MLLIIILGYVGVITAFLLGLMRAAAHGDAQRSWGTPARYCARAQRSTRHSGGGCCLCASTLCAVTGSSTDMWADRRASMS